ncbi:MAG: anti-sigma factor family protein [Cellulosilyticaceae bacterium]
MKCEYSENWLNLYVDNELTVEEYNQITKHLKKCNKCKQIVEDILEIKNLLKNTSNIELPSNFHQTLMNSVKSIKQEQKINIQKSIYKITPMIATLTAASILLISLNSIKSTNAFNDRQNIDAGDTNIESRMAMPDSANIVSEDNSTSMMMEKNRSMDYSVWKIAKQDAEMLKQFIIENNNLYNNVEIVEKELQTIILNFEDDNQMNLFHEKLLGRIPIIERDMYASLNVEIQVIE